MLLNSSMGLEAMIAATQGATGLKAAKAEAAAQ
jgi:hypothetical protein